MIQFKTYNPVYPSPIVWLPFHCDWMASQDDDDAVMMMRKRGRGEQQQLGGREELFMDRKLGYVLSSQQ